MSHHVRAVVAHYDERAASYDESAMHRGLTEAVADGVDLDGVEVVLDVATGTGLMLRSLVARRASLRLVGVDLSPAMLAVARDALPRAAFVLVGPRGSARRQGGPASFRPAAKQIHGPHHGGFVRRHESYASPELVSSDLASHGFTPELHTDWTDGEDRLLVCEMSRK